MSNYTAEERALLALLKKLYWRDAPKVTTCFAAMSLSQAWPGRPQSLGTLEHALSSLVDRGDLTYSDMSYCLTESGVRAIGAVPQAPADGGGTD
jgi:hypothetical protein